MNNRIKRIRESAKFLLDTGLLFEINRQILNPLGLALEVDVITDKTGAVETVFGKVWDYRDDPEGILMPDENYQTGLQKFTTFMSDEGNAILERRKANLGFITQPPPDEKDDNEEIEESDEKDSNL